MNDRREEAERTDLHRALTLLLIEQGAFLATLDWRDAEAVALAERRGRIIGTHRTNVEKLMPQADVSRDTTDEDAPLSDEDVAALRSSLHRRLVRHADRLGREELARRLRARGLDPDEAGLEFLASLGPATA